MRNILFTLTALVALTLVGVYGCAPHTPGDSSTPSTSAVMQQLATQMPGVVDSVVDILARDPLVPQDAKDMASGYGAWVKDGVQSVATMASAQTADQLAGAFAGLASVAAKAPVGSDAQGQLGNYLGWGNLLLRLAGAAAPLVLSQGWTLPGAV